MQGVAEYPRCYGTSLPHPMQESNPKVPADFDSRAPSLPLHFSPRDAALRNESTEASRFFPSLVQFPRDAQVVTMPGFNNESKKVNMEQKEHATVCGQGGFGLIGTESFKIDGQQDVLRKSKMPPSASPSEVLKQQASSTSSRVDEAVVTGVAEPACGQSLFHSSDPRFRPDAHSLRRFCPVSSRNNPYIDALKAPSWPQLLEPAGTGYSFPGEEWSNYGMIGKCPSFSAVPNYLHHHPAYKTDQLGAYEQRAAFPTAAIFHQPARNAPAFFPDQLQPAAGGNTVDYTTSLGLGGSVDACSTDERASVYERGMWPGSYRTDEGHWASERLVGKSQSMRALYCCHKEENEALRRALYSMRRAADQESRFPGADMDHLSGASASAKNQVGRAQLQNVDTRFNARLGDKMQDRYVAMDAAEGRTVSMRERGRWCERDKAGGEKAGAGHGFSYPIWSPERARGDAMRKQMPECGCRQEGGAAFYGGHRLYFGGGAPREGRWQQAESQWLRWGDGWQGREEAGEPTQSKTWQSISSDGSGGAALTMKEQQLTRGGSDGGGRTSAASGVDESRCAMCDGKLRRLRNPSATKKLSLPLRLCPACHPRPAASLPPSTTKAPATSPPLSPPFLRHSSASARGRHHTAATVATAISLACKPNIAAAASSSDSRKKSKNRIVELCRHLVGLSMKPGAT